MNIISCIALVLVAIVAPIYANSGVDGFYNFFIIGGTPATRGRYEYASNLYFSSGASRPSCGGTLIAPNIVLTAGHCQGAVEVGVGCYDVTANEDCDRIRVDREIVHPNYRAGGSLSNDVSILVLESNSRFAPIPLVADDTYLGQFTTGFPLTVMGWGTTVQGQNAASDVLLEVEVGYVSQQSCDNSYSGRIGDSMMCAASPGKDSCQGDSGGPLIAKCDSTGRDVLVGVVSWGYGCASPSYPGVYARVSNVWPWIESTLRNLGALNSITSPVPGLSSFCSGGNGPSPTPFPTPKPTPFPTPAPVQQTCFDRVPSGLQYSNGQRAPCNELYQYCRRYSIVRERCPDTCGLCGTAAAVDSRSIDTSEDVELDDLVLTSESKQEADVAIIAGAFGGAIACAAAFIGMFMKLTKRSV